MTKKSSIVFAIIAGAEFLLCALSLAIQDIGLLIKGTVVFSWASEVMFFVIFAAFAVLLFLHHKNILLVIAGFANLALNVYFLVANFRLLMVFPLLSALSLLFVIVINCASPLQNLSGITKIIWFLPFVFILIYHIYVWIDFGYFRFLKDTWFVLIFDLRESAAYLFFGLWLLEARTVRAKEPVSQETRGA